MDTRDTMLTTIDNPYNPFTQWNAWWSYDHEYNHCTWELVDRFAYTSETLPQSINDRAIEEAMQLIIKEDYEQKYLIVNKSFDFNSFKKNCDAARKRMFEAPSN